MPSIATKDLIKVYRAGKSEVIALRGLDMQVADGELVAVRGPSGCGKTTLLNLLGGLDGPFFVPDGLLHLRKGPIEFLEVPALRRRIDWLDLDHRTDALEERDLDVDQREEFLLVEALD